MKKGLILATSVLLAVGCAKKEDVKAANETNFSNAIEQYLDKKGELCLGLNKFPIDLNKIEQRMNNSPFSKAKRMEALEKNGLASGEQITIDSIGWNGKPTGSKVDVKRYQLTEKGKKFYREKEVESISLGGPKTVMKGDLCFGQLALDKVVKWEGPMKFGDYQEAQIFYTYKINGLAEWANNSDMQASFSSVEHYVNGAKTKQDSHPVKLTNLGWEARGLN